MFKALFSSVGILFLVNSSWASTEPPSILRGRPLLLSKLYHCKLLPRGQRDDQIQISLQFMGKHSEIAILQGLNEKQVEYYAEVKDQAAAQSASPVYEKFGAASDARAAMVLSKDSSDRFKLTQLKKRIQITTEGPGKPKNLECSQN